MAGIRLAAVTQQMGGRGKNCFKNACRASLVSLFALCENSVTLFLNYVGTHAQAFLNKTKLHASRSEDRTSVSSTTPTNVKEKENTPPTVLPGKKSTNYQS